MQKLLSHKWLLLSLFVAILAGRTLLTSRHFYTHDDIQVFRVNEFIECFKRGEIPCRWSANLGKGYGYPWFNYYPPMIYIISGLIHLSGFSIIASLNLLMFLSFILAAWGMYLLVKELTDRGDLAFLGSTLFTLYPFHATNVFLRGVYAENLAWSLTPFVLLAISRQIKSGHFSHSLPFLFAGIFLTHIISSFLVVGFAVFWLILFSCKTWRQLLLQILLGIGISAFFFLPAIFEKNLVQSESLIQGYYAYFNHFVSLKQLFLEYKWNYGASYWADPPQEMGFMIGHVHTIFLGILLVIGLFSRRKIKQQKLIFGLLFATGFVLFLTHSKSAFIWQLLPSLAYIQFPWRFVGWTGIPLIISASLLMKYLPRLLSYSITLLVTIALLLYSYPFFFPRDYDVYSDADFLTGSLRADQQTKSLFDYLPKTVHQIPTIQSGIFYFPGWTSRTKIEVDAETGVIVDTSPDLAWRETPFRLAMDIVSVISLIGYVMYNKWYAKN